MYENTLDALPLECKLKDGCAFGYLNVTDIVNNTLFLSERSVLRRRFEKEATDFLGVNVSPFGDNTSY